MCQGFYFLLAKLATSSIKIKVDFLRAVGDDALILSPGAASRTIMPEVPKQ